MKGERGITLIALVITIIVLLILAAISIATLTGENGILNKANRATEENKKAEYEEIIKLIGNGIRDEKVLENLSAEAFIARYKEEIKKEIGKGKLLEGASVENRDTTTLMVTTKEGWVYEITENKVELLGKKGENPPPDLQETDIDFILTPSGYTTGNVTVEIKLKIEIQGFVLQYSRDGENWNNYTEEITYTENGPIYARLINRLEETGQVASKEINKIDKKPPKAEISLDHPTVEVGDTITATVIQSDEGDSGVNITKCKWGYTTTDIKTLGENPSSYTGGYFKEGQTKIQLNIPTLGTYYLHILTVDNAGNSEETISNVITIKKPPTVEDLKNGNEVSYVAKNGTTIRCKVLWDSSSTYGKQGVQIIAMNSVETVSLGDVTPEWGVTANLLNNAITTLNNKASAYANPSYVNSTRCVGSNPTNPSAENTATWPYNYSGTATVKKTDENYSSDMAQLSKLGIKNIGVGYWLASRGLTESNTDGYLGIRWCDGSSTLVCGSGFYIRSGSSVSTANGNMWHGNSYGLRPIFTLKPEIKIVNNNGIYTLSV